MIHSRSVIFRVGLTAVLAAVLAGSALYWLRPAVQPDWTDRELQLMNRCGLPTCLPCLPIHPTPSPTIPLRPASVIACSSVPASAATANSRSRVAIGPSAASPAAVSSARPLGESKRNTPSIVGKARCIECHNGPLRTNNEFHNTGIMSAAGEDSRSRPN